MISNFLPSNSFNFHFCFFSQCKHLDFIQYPNTAISDVFVVVGLLFFPAVTIHGGIFPCVFCDFFFF